MAGRSWSDDERRHALELYSEHGAGHASRETGIPEGTIASWASRSGIANHAPEKLAAANEVKWLQWQDRRLMLIHQMGYVAEVALAQALTAAQNGDGREAKDFATTMAILVDKAQLLAGDVTGALSVASREAREEVLDRARGRALELVEARTA